MVRGKDRERGAAIVEFALVVSVLFLLLFGIIQFGLALHAQQGLQAGAREGARIAALPHTTKDQVITRVLQSVSGFDPAVAPEQCPPSTPGSYCVTVMPQVEKPCDLRRGEQVTVEVTHKASIDIPLWSTDLLLKGQGVYRCEG